MKRHIFPAFAIIFTICFVATAQVPLNTLVLITKAEDARRFDPLLEGLMKSPNVVIRKRAALAAGRIGGERALPMLIELLERDSDNDVLAIAAFALGETESIAAAEPILGQFKGQLACENCSVFIFGADRSPNLSAYLIEAAGKVAAANSKEDISKQLGNLIIDFLNYESSRTTSQNTHSVLLGLTAALRARPDGADIVVSKFLTHPDVRIRTDAANTLTRLRAKNANETLRKMIVSEPDGAARANAARALGAAEDKDAVGLLLNAATTDADLRVRVSAMRALGGLKDAKAADKLLEYGNAVLARRGQSRFRKPIENSELLEIVTALGRLIPNSEHEKAITFLRRLRAVDGYASPETEISFARVAPKMYVAEDAEPIFMYSDPNAAAAYGQGLAEIAAAKNDELSAQAGQKLTAFVAGMATGVKPKDQNKMLLAMPELTRSLAALKPDNLDEILRGQIANDDVFIRAAAAELLGERPLTKENFASLEKASTLSLLKDKHDNDAMLAILDALAKLDKKAATGSLLMALNSRDYLVRKKVFELLDDKELEKTSPGMPLMVKFARDKKQDQVQPYLSAFGTKLGQLLNSDLDYRRALSRKNGSIKAVLTTEKGAFTIVFNPEEAPLTVDNWVKLARSGYFNGLEVHRVVPNFVMQDGDPRGDGNGGPGWSIRCEVNMLRYDRGAVGMALSGKDTGGSQWFVTHSPQPHLDGGYTVFGHVDEAGMKVVDNIVRGDKILKVTIVGR